MAAPMFNVFVGAETGLLKGVQTHKKVHQNLNSVTSLQKDAEICTMCWDNPDETKFYVALHNQAVKCFNVLQSSFEGTIDCSGGTGPIKGLEKYEGSLITCVESGFVKVWSETQESQIELNAGENICRMRKSPYQPNVIATGGRENDLKLWDLESPAEPTFRAKNVPHDMLNLRVPVWVQDMQFCSNGKQVVVCTGHHQVRMYDPSTPQRRPVMKMECGEHPLMSLALTSDDNLVIVGNARGRMSLLDLRKKALVHRYKGFAGSIRSIQCHPSLPLVASCGLDRFLRVHDVNTHKLLHKVYLKSRLNCLLLRTDFNVGEVQQSSKEPTASELSEAEEDDELWRNMSVVAEQDRSTNVPKRKRKKLKVV